jgi:hypothetical protein
VTTLVSRLFLLLSAISLVAACFALWQSLRVLFAVARSALPESARSEATRETPGRSATEPVGFEPSGRLSCVHCGVNNDVDALFCKRCGNPLEAALEKRGSES